MTVVKLWTTYPRTRAYYNKLVATEDFLIEELDMVDTEVCNPLHLERAITALQECKQQFLVHFEESFNDAPENELVQENTELPVMPIREDKDEK